MAGTEADVQLGLRLGGSRVLRLRLCSKVE